MPLYDFYCPDCDRTYELRVQTPKSSARCPECQGNLERKIPAPNIRTSKKSGVTRILVRDTPFGFKLVEYENEEMDHQVTGIRIACGQFIGFGRIKRTDKASEKREIERAADLIINTLKEH